MPWGQAQYAFELHKNNGGPNAVDCGILALREAMRRQLGEEGCFAGPVANIRAEMIQMFLNLPDHQQMLMANQYLGSTDNETIASLRTKTIHHLRTRMLNWHTLVMYVQWKFPGRVNLAIWKSAGGVYMFEGGTTLVPNLPILHIAHHHLHFEALTPLQGDAVARAIMGRVDNAEVYYTSNSNEELVQLLVAPHPTKRGFVLIQRKTSPTVYECGIDSAFMKSINKLMPMETGVSHWFDYSEALPVPPSMKSDLDYFLMIQGIPLPQEEDLIQGIARL